MADGQFEQVVERHAGTFGSAPAHRKWHGPSDIRPMIEFLSVMDAGNLMRVTPEKGLLPAALHRPVQRLRGRGTR